jgi:signal transduction histidine kinase
MDASRLEIEAGVRPAHLERVAVAEMIQSVVDLIEPQLKQERREVRFQVADSLFVRADPGRLRQVLLNISINALKYSPAGTPLLFSARRTFDSAPSVIISVTDRGKGIKPQDQTLLFQRFVGLGLYISRRLIEAMGGKIWVESRGIPGAGSTFSIQLPVA